MSTRARAWLNIRLGEDGQGYVWGDGTKVDLASGFFDWMDGEPTQERESEEHICENTCQYRFDNECDDGGPGAQYNLCSFGTDCEDCEVYMNLPDRIIYTPAEECITFSIEEGGAYADEICTKKNEFICEFDLGTPVPTIPTFSPTPAPTLPTVAPSVMPTVPPTPPTLNPTYYPTYFPTKEPTFNNNNRFDLGTLDCDDLGQCIEYLLEGSTISAPNRYGNPSGEHIYDFIAEEAVSLTFTTCSTDTDYDTYLRLFVACVVEDCDEGEARD
jgi:hypothetical protein